MLKRIFSVFLVFLFLPVVSFAVDLSGMSFNELVALKNQIDLAIWKSSEWQEVLVPQGLWQVGVDIPAGHWTITATGKSYCRIKYGDVLDDSNEISYRSQNYQSEYIYSKNSVLYDENSSRVQMDIDMKDGFYVQIEQGNCIFTPYSGKPLLGFSKGNGFVKIECTPEPTPVPVDPDGYAKFDYQKASRYPEDYATTRVIIEGEVVQLLGSPKEGYDMRISTEGSYGNIVYIIAPSDTLPVARILDGDLVRIKARMYGVHTYESKGAGEITLPCALAHSVEILNLQ